MASLNIERVQAPTGGMNSDASPDYVAATQGVHLMNLLVGTPGKVSMRGPVTSNVTGMTTVGSPPDAFWSFDDFALVKGNSGGVKTHRVVVATSTKTDVTATIVESPFNSVHARYGAYVYGAIVDAANPQLGKWDGAASAIVPMANAPFQFTDLQVYAQRLFVLGGTLPGTTTPVINSSRVLFFTDPDPAADLSLLASWRDDTVTVPVINQLQYDGDDTPVALAGCGKYLAILGSRSIRILTGSGSSTFSVRTLSTNHGCIPLGGRGSVVEVDDGFYFVSDRGYCFCDGSTVTVVSDNAVTRALVTDNFGYTAAMFGHGHIALRGPAGTCYLFHIASRSWTRVAMDIAASTTPEAVFRTNTYPILWQAGGLRVADKITQPAGSASGTLGTETDGTTTTTIKSEWRSRFVSLASPGQMATINRVLFDFKFWNSNIAPFDTNAWRVQVVDAFGTVLSDTTAESQAVSNRRSRLTVDVFAEADTVQLIVTNAATGAATLFAGEIYDAWIEYAPAANRPTR